MPPTERHEVLRGTSQNSTQLARVASTEGAALFVGQGKYGEPEQIRTEGDLGLALSIDKVKLLSDSHWQPLFRATCPIMSLRTFSQAVNV